jgi:hypothetical protein
MIRRHLLGLLGGAAVGGTFLARPAHADPSPVLPSRAEVLSKLRLVNDHWINGHGDPGNSGWARATYFSGNMAAYRATNEPRPGWRTRLVPPATLCCLLAPGPGKPGLTPPGGYTEHPSPQSQG